MKGFIERLTLLIHWIGFVVIVGGVVAGLGLALNETRLYMTEDNELGDYSPLLPQSFDYATGRQLGFSDEQLATMAAGAINYDMSNALQAGLNYSEILNLLSFQLPQTGGIITPEPRNPSFLANLFRSRLEDHLLLSLSLIAFGLFLWVLKWLISGNKSLWPWKSSE